MVGGFPNSARAADGARCWRKKVKESEAEEGELRAGHANNETCLSYRSVPELNIQYGGWNTILFLKLLRCELWIFEQAEKVATTRLLICENAQAVQKLWRLVVARIFL